MSFSIGLDAIAYGEASMAEAAETVRETFKRKGKAGHEAVYTALKSWVWRAINDRRNDEELIGWMDLLSRATARLENPLSIKLEGFLELLHVSLMAAESARAHDPLSGKHAVAILASLRAQNVETSRKLLKRMTGLKDSNLTQVMSPLIINGLVRRSIKGREVSYSLTHEGLAAIDDRAPERQTIEVSYLTRLLSSDTLDAFEQFTKSSAGRYFHYVHKDDLQEKLVGSDRTRSDRVSESYDPMILLAEPPKQLLVGALV